MVNFGQMNRLGGAAFFHHCTEAIDPKVEFDVNVSISVTGGSSAMHIHYASV